MFSYGFGTGAMARYMFLFRGADLSFAVVLGLIYLIRRGTAPAGESRGMALQLNYPAYAGATRVVGETAQTPCETSG